MTEAEMMALPEARERFALWMDPADPRCCFFLGPFGVEWSVGKARMNQEGKWDAREDWQLVRMNRYV